MKNIWLLSFGLFIWSCSGSSVSDLTPEQLIVETLQQETRYFCERDLTNWEEQWSHKSFVSKMYTGNAEFKEFVGWEEVKQNTVDHIRDFPGLIPIPVSNQDYIIELFGEAAFVFYSYNGERGMVRETRFMVKEGGKWKIARMQTIL